MSDSLMIIIGIVIAVILMFVWPLLAMSERTDDISQTLVQSATSEFVDKISISGQIKQSDYDAFIQTITATGNTYDVEIEVQHLDENPGKKSVTTSGNLIGENVRYSTFTSEILNEMDEINPITHQRNGTYRLSKGDNVIVTVKNTNKTMAQMLRSTFYKIKGEGTYQIAASASSMVVNTGKTN